MFFLTQADVDFLKRLKAKYENGNIGSPIRTNEVPGEDAQAPEVFLVSVDSDIEPGVSGTGTYAGTGTGTGTGESGEVGLSGWGEATRLRINEESDVVEVMNDSKLFIRNPYSSKIAMGTICLAIRDKCGQYIPVQSGSTGTLIVQFAIMSVTDRTYASSSILRRPTGVSTVPEEVNGVITVWDRNKPKFLSEPSILLVNRRGTAAWMEFPGRAPEWVIIGLDCPDSSYDDDVDDQYFI
jgi:hypothetical protein